MFVWAMIYTCCTPEFTHPQIDKKNPVRPLRLPRQDFHTCRMLCSWCSSHLLPAEQRVSYTLPGSFINLQGSRQLCLWERMVVAMASLRGTPLQFRVHKFWEGKRPWGTLECLQNHPTNSKGKKRCAAWCKFQQLRRPKSSKPALSKDVEIGSASDTQSDVYALMQRSHAQNTASKALHGFPRNAFQMSNVWFVHFEWFM